MANKLFVQYSTDFGDPNNWKPVGVPQSGDVASLYMSGAVAAGTLPAGVRITVTTFANNGVFSSLILQNAIVPADTRISESTNYGVIYPASLSFAGAVTNNGVLVFNGGLEAIGLPSGTTLTNNGTINFAGSAQVSAKSSDVAFVNNGLIRTVFGKMAYLGVPVGGTGTISVSVSCGVEFGAGVAAGQTVQFVGGADAGSAVQIDQPGTFAAAIGGFVAGDRVTLSNVAASSASFVPSGSGQGTLQLFNGTSTPVASLKFNGVYATGDFSLSPSGTSLVITTDVVNAATGSTAAATASGLFRFFDTQDGTHFLTSSVAERDAVLVSRPDLVQESNGFGAQVAASGATESIYRFFDTVHGTHFFTASAAERDQVIATRGDLTFENSATFLEDATAQAGDVAVYRLFSKADGTHLYTGGAETGALTTPGGAGYRADLVSEGVSFYAPTGTYF